MTDTHYVVGDFIRFLAKVGNPGARIAVGFFVVPHVVIKFNHETTKWETAPDTHGYGHNHSDHALDACKYAVSNERTKHKSR